MAIEHISVYPRPPRDAKNVGEIKDYLQKLYSSLIRNDSVMREGTRKDEKADRPWVYPEDYGAKGDGVTDDGAAIQSAITAAGANGRIVFSDKTYLVTTTVNLPATDLTLSGSGTAVLDTSGTNSIFKQTNHGALIRIEGLKFTGGGYGVEFDCADGGESFYEYSINHCTFAMDTGIYGLYIVGAREGTVENCYFTTGNGIYRSHAVVTIVRGCIFRSTQTQVGIAIYDNGVGVAYSAGLSVIDSIIMGYEYGVISSRCDDLNISGCTIDYNTWSIRLLGQDRGSITACYIGSNGVNPALYMATATDKTSNIIVANNKFVGNYTTGNDYDCIYINGADSIRIVNNSIGFYTRYGVSYDGMTYGTVSGNYFVPRTTFGVNSIYAANDDSSNLIALNQFVTYPSSTLWAQKFMNIGDVSSGGTTPISFYDTDASVYAQGLVGSDTAYHYPYLLFGKSAGSISVPTDVSALHYLGGINCYGYKNSAFRLAASVIARCVSVGTNIVEGKLEFYCTDAAGNSDIPLSLTSDVATVTGDINVTEAYQIDGADVVNQDVTTTAGPTFDHLHITNGATFGDQPRTATSLYRRYYHIPLGSSNPGASGATWVDAGANSTGGWQLNAAGETIRGGSDVHSDWDGGSDLKVEVRFMINAAGAAPADTVDLKLVCYYKGVGDTVTKTQTVEVPTTVGAAAQYTAFKADFTIDWNATDNVVEAGDHISFYLNLETDTSEVDDVTITGMSYSYLTTHLGVEDGDE